MTLGQWLRGETGKADGTDALEGAEAAYYATGGDDDVLLDISWFVDVLSDGTAITWCIDD